MSVSFRPMTLQDIEAVFCIEQQAYPFPWSKRIFEQSVSSNKYCVVMEQEKEILGYAIVSYVVGEAELLNICITPSHQAKGYGHTLLNHIIESATNSGNSDMYLEVRASNVSAIHVYEKAGFHEIGHRKGYYPADSGREDAILMALPLSL